MATMRNLPDPHPINKLLRPHFRDTIAINTRARKTLINEGGILAKAFAIGGPGMGEFLEKAYGHYHVDWTNIKKNTKWRGVDDPEKLPGYYYRDDGLEIFEAIEEYVRDIVGAFYKSDKEVESDVELLAWAEDIYKNAFPGTPQGHGFPQQITTREVLVERCTVIIFTGSAQHSSINFEQYSVYGHVPSAPFSMRLPPPTEKGSADHKLLMDTLPDKESAQKGMSITRVLSQYSDDEVMITYS